MSELTKGFSDAYALPWTIKHYGEFDAIFSAGELRLCYVSRPDTERKRAAMSYLVQCANLMPEIAHDLKLFFDRRAYIRSPVSEVDLKRLYNRIAELVGTAQIEETELPD